MRFGNVHRLLLAQFERTLVGSPDSARNSGAEAGLFQIIQRLGGRPTWGGDLVPQSGWMSFRALIERGGTLDGLQDELLGNAAGESHVDARVD